MGTVVAGVDNDGVVGDAHVVERLEQRANGVVVLVTPWKILGGTYAFGLAPAMLAADVNVGIGLPAFTGPLGRTFGSFNFETGDTNLAPGDTGIIPVILGWNQGNFHWNFAVFALAPTGDYSTKQLANTGLNHWALMPRVAATCAFPCCWGKYREFWALEAGYSEAALALANKFKSFPPDSLAFGTGNFAERTAN